MPGPKLPKMLHLIMLGFLTILAFISKTRQNFVDPEAIQVAEAICMLDMMDHELNTRSDNDSEPIFDGENAVDLSYIYGEHSNTFQTVPYLNYESAKDMQDNLCTSIMWISPEKMNIPVVHGDLEHATFEFRYRPETPKLKPGMSKRAATLATKRFDSRQEMSDWSSILCEYFGYEKGPVKYFGYYIAREMGERLREASVMILDDEMCRKILSEEILQMLESLSVKLPECFDPACRLLKGSSEWQRRVEKDTFAMINYLYDISCIAYPSKYKDTSKQAQAVAKMARQIFSRNL